MGQVRQRKHRARVLVFVIWLAVAAISACSGPSDGGEGSSAPTASSDGEGPAGAAVDLSLRDQEFRVPEDSRRVGTVLAESDAQAQITFALIATAEEIPGEALFVIDADSGEITVVEGRSLDFESAEVHRLEVQARAEGSEGASATITVLVENVPENRIAFRAQGFDVPEGNQHVGNQHVGTLKATATTQGETIRFAVLSDEEGQATVSEAFPFVVDARSGQIDVAEGANLDWEARTGYAFRVVASAADAPAAEAQIAVRVLDVEEEITFLPQKFVVEEGTRALGTLEATVSDGQEVVFAEVSELFAVSAAGEVRVAEGQDLDFELGEVHVFSVAASAVGAREVVTSITVEVLNLIENRIVFAEGQGFDVVEDAAPGTLVGTVRAYAEREPVVHFSTESEIFLLERETGRLFLSGSIAAEQGSSYTLAVEVSSKDALAVTRAVTVTVLEAQIKNRIVFAEGQGFYVAKDAAPGTLVGTVRAHAEQAVVHFSTESDVFSLEQTTGRLFLTESIAAEQSSSYTLAVEVSSKDALAVTRAVTVTVLEAQDGSAARPYTVSSLEELQRVATGFRNLVRPIAASVADSLAFHYRQLADIDASPTAAADYISGRVDAGGALESGRGFLPIGNCGADGPCASVPDADGEDLPFVGHYDGQGYVIRGLSIVRAADCEAEIPFYCESNVGLFRALGEGGTIKNVVLEDGKVSGVDRVGGLVGINRGQVAGSSVSGAITGQDEVGGLVGINHGQVEGSYHVGGLVRGRLAVGGGVGENEGSVRDSFAASALEGFNFVGGLVGTNRGEVLRGHAAGLVAGSSVIGGLVGANTGTVQASFATSEIAGLIANVGGLVASNSGEISHSYAVGAVTGVSAVGGLVGHLGEGGTLSDSYAASALEGEQWLGGLVGRNLAGGEAAPRSYRLVVSSDDATPGAAPDDGLGMPIDAAGLLALTCSGTGATAPIFRLLDAEVGLLACSTVEATAFPWDFGGSEAWPVLQAPVGSVFDAAAQRALIDFARVERVEDVFPETSYTLTALAMSGLPALPIDRSRRYLWVVPEVFSNVDGRHSATIHFVTPALPEGHSSARYTLVLVILEEDAQGSLVRVYADTLSLLLLPSSR